MGTTGGADVRKQGPSRQRKQQAQRQGSRNSDHVFREQWQSPLLCSVLHFKPPGGGLSPGACLSSDTCGMSQTTWGPVDSPFAGAVLAFAPIAYPPPLPPAMRTPQSTSFTSPGTGWAAAYVSGAPWSPACARACPAFLSAADLLLWVCSRVKPCMFCCVFSSGSV